MTQVTITSYSKLDANVLGQILERWSSMERANASDARIIGALAKDLYRAAEADWIRAVGAIVGIFEWPQKSLFLTAVDVASGERKVFDATCGVPIVQAIAASAAIPGVFASVEIAGKRYMDGQVLSCTHADFLLQQPRAEGQAEVVIVMPTNHHTAPRIGPVAEREAAAEVEKL